VALLAKISEVNALPAHYVCPKCKYHEFYSEDITADGFDLPIKMCPKCQSRMKSDGHNIPFESFLGTAGAPKVPDIDLNFSGEFQGTAHKYISDMFGKSNAFRAGTVMTVADKTAYGFVKKYFDETHQIEKNEEIAEITYLQRMLVDNKRNNGLHAGGMIVIPNTHNGKELDIHDFCPYSLPPTIGTNDEDEQC
jgi:DNA polymerase-3 subunit alpha (Gram-positive type)